ncbi:MAG: undecaprenyldiphospho-muramoylpentapeptide beta-N-acetylglucosaminyltransferase [Gammaproteobacteria bacterium]
MMKRILIMAGGTGGHIFPALAVAHALQRRGADVHWLGTSDGLENQLVPKENIPITYINVTGLRNKGFRKWLSAPWQLLRSVYQARHAIQAINPDVILGMGGFVSGPGGLAAWLSRKPLLIHEQNAVAGLTNRVLARFATQILAAFPEAFASNYRATVIGNPIRSEIQRLPAPTIRFQGRNGTLRLLVMGGSQGALIFNQLLPQALALLPTAERPQIWHQTGRYQKQAEQGYHSLNLDAKIQPFIEDMAQAYAWADMVLCRAGALTVSELAAVGIGSLLVPYPHAVDDHQTRNAEYLVKAGAAMLLPQKQLTAERLADTLRQLAGQRQQWLAMAQAARGLEQANATQKVVEYCLAAR